MPRGATEVADVFRRYGDAYRQQHGSSLSTAQRRVMTAIEQCRTAALGGHVEQCDACGHQRIAYNSCRNRHCPKCQSLARAEWLEDRRSELLTTPYFHVVFTVPQEIAANRLLQQGTGLRYPVPHRRPDPANDRRRSRASRRRAWLLRRPSHLGPDASPSSAPALRRCRRRSLSRRQSLDRLSAQLLSAGPRARSSLPSAVPGLSETGLRR